MMRPEGYRKALRIMKLAEKFHLPIVSLIDTPGAYPGIGAEERGQGEAIARNLFEMSSLKTPIIAIVIGKELAEELWALEFVIKCLCLRIHGTLLLALKGAHPFCGEMRLKRLKQQMP